jgi:hypothetical protein
MKACPDLPWSSGSAIVKPEEEKLATQIRKYVDNDV